jgi:serine/threonine-protein kinase
MFFKKQQKFPFACLFTAEDTAYELVTDLGMGPHRERLLIARPHTREGIGGWVLVRALGKAADGRALLQLQSEMALASRLEHPNIARVLGLHETPEALYAVVEYVGGRSLETAISFSMMRQRNYSEAFALYVCAELAAALAHAHARADEAGTPLDIVHRDLCPARIRLDSHGRVKLCEFGLASSRLRNQRATSLWRARGDVFYASPEQLLGGKVDARSDLFCVGLLLLELTTGNHLFAEGKVDAQRVASLLAGLSAGQRQEIATRVKEELPACSEYLAARAATLAPEDVERAAQWLPAPVKVILHKLLCRVPADRYPSAVEMERDLRARLGALDRPYGAAQALEEVLGAHSEAEELRDEVDVAEEGVLPPAVRETPLDEATTEPM